MSVERERLPGWAGARPPARAPIDGRFVTLTPVDVARDAAPLFQAAEGPGADPALWDYMPVGPFGTQEAFTAWLEGAAASTDPLFFTIIDKATNTPAGILSYLRIDLPHGVTEIGHIWFGPALQRTRQATEAIALISRDAFEHLDNRRLEWKCDALNARSQRAARRFGFTYEGTFRQHRVVKGYNRDTAWYAILDRDWPAIARAYDTWLADDNFDDEGRQRRRLEEIREEIVLDGVRRGVNAAK